MRNKKSFILVLTLAVGLLPGVGLASLSDTVALYQKTKMLEISSKALINLNPDLEESFNNIYRSIISSLKDEIYQIEHPKAASVLITTPSSLEKDKLVTINFSRVPSSSLSPVNFFVEESGERTLGLLAADITGNSFDWQVADNFWVGKNYFLAAKDKNGNLLGRSSAFQVSPSTVATNVSMTASPLIPPPANAPVASPDINFGSVGFWSFDNYSDVCSTKGNAVTNAIGESGSALYVDGNGSYCQVAARKSLYQNNFTISLWAKSDAHYANGWKDSGWFASLRDKAGFVIGPVDGSKSVTFNIYDDKSTPALTSYLVGTVTPDDITSWHNYALTYDGSVANVYLDGVLATSTNLIISRSDGGTSNLYFGTDNISPVQQFGAGSLDEIRLYNRALSSCEMEILAGKTCNGLSLNSFSRNQMASLLSQAENVLMNLKRLLSPAN